MKSAPAIGVALALALLTALVPFAANADRGRGHGHGWHNGHGVTYVHRVHGHHRHHGHHGRWHHGHHHGHLGWWWIVGSTWYFYPRVVYPYPDHRAATVVIQQPPMASGPAPTQYWYFCESSQTYYPYVASCAEGWKPVPATPQ
jgi:hypothetical protein